MITKSKFIVVKHDAKRARLHYDLRFIMPKSKIWASFAVRKGLPDKPGTKVLAVRTHDHTDEEALFIGTIKQGYGAGKLTKFDDGQCIIHKYTPSHIILELKGKKFKGIYHMISTGVMNKKEFKKRSYMLFKSKKTVLEWYLKEIGTVGRIAVGMATGVPLAGQGRRITPERCKQLYPNNPGRYQACIDSAKPATESSHVSEREWNEPDSYKTYLRRDRFIKQNRDLSYSDEYNDETHSQQPTYVGIHSKMGGDYMGRQKSANMFRDPHTGMERLNIKDKENEFRFSFLKPGSKSKLDPGESYENTTLKSDRQEKEFPKKSEFPNLTEVYLTYLDEQGMADRIPSGGIAEDTEEAQSERISADLSWDKTPRTVGKVYKGAKYD
jgi:DNA ligase D-like protein (predicted 3'-phosphoesterase)